jgi:hypothetical protein
MALNTIDAKIKRLNNMGGYIAPRTAEVLKHLVEQSQMQAAEGCAMAMNFTDLQQQIYDIKSDKAEIQTLKADFKKLKNDNRLFLFVIVAAWLAVGGMLGWVAHYG